MNKEKAEKAFDEIKEIKEEIYSLLEKMEKIMNKTGVGARLHLGDVTIDYKVCSAKFAKLVGAEEDEYGECDEIYDLADEFDFSFYSYNEGWTVSSYNC